MAEHRNEFGQVSGTCEKFGGGFVHFAEVWGWFCALWGSLGMSLRTFGVVSDEKRLLSEQKGGIWGDLSELNTQLVENKIEFHRRNAQICRIHPNLSKFRSIPHFLHEKGKKRSTDARTHRNYTASELGMPF